MKKRLFIAIDFPPQVKKQIGQLIDELKKSYPEIRWENYRNLHLTLKFLGWTDKTEEIIKRIEEAVCGIKPFWFQLTDIGFFLKESLIVWLGAESQEGLFKLVGNLEGEMVKLGFPCEKRPFTAHVTLGRKRHACPALKWREIAQGLQNFKTPGFERFRVEQIVLMESQLSPSGSIYIPIAVRGLIS